VGHLLHQRQQLIPAVQPVSHQGMGDRGGLVVPFVNATSPPMTSALLSFAVSVMHTA